MTLDGPAERPGPRAWWRAIEPVHAVTYFAPESHQALRDTGLRGFWMGYFAARAAPVGAVGPSTVAAAFFSFHPAMVERSIPDAWSFADPAAVLVARRTAAAAALRRLAPDVEDRARALLPVLDPVCRTADCAGRVLAAANRALAVPDDPVEALWQACTTLREHRGDGHVAALVAAGLTGSQAVVLFALSEDLPAGMFRDSRGWSTGEWEAARRELEDGGLVHGDRVTVAGAELRRSIEDTTDRRAAPPFEGLDRDQLMAAYRGLAGLAGVVASGGDIPFPNPMGLPVPD